MRTRLALVVAAATAAAAFAYGVTAADLSLEGVTDFRAVPTDDGRYLVCTYRPADAAEDLLALCEAGTYHRVADPTVFSSGSRIRRAFSLADDGKFYLVCGRSHAYDYILTWDACARDLQTTLTDVAVIDYGSAPRPWLAYAQFQHLVDATGSHDALDADLIPFYAATNGDGPPFLPEMPTGVYVYYGDGTSGPLFSASASSFLAGGIGSAWTSPPANALDGRLDTAWAEGAAGPGTGEWLELAAAVPARITSVAVWGGLGVNAATMTANAAPASVEVQLDGKIVGTLTPAADAPYWGEWRADAPIAVESIRLVITAVISGAETEDCYVGEVVVR